MLASRPQAKGVAGSGSIYGGFQGPFLVFFFFFGGGGGGGGGVGGRGEGWEGRLGAVGLLNNQGADPQRNLARSGGSRAPWIFMEYA